MCVLGIPISTSAQQPGDHHRLAVPFSLLFIFSLDDPYEDRKIPQTIFSFYILLTFFFHF